MAAWGYVSNGQVIEVYDVLPTNWRNISNFYLLQDQPEPLKSLSWFPVVNITQPCNPLTETYGPVEYSFNAHQQVILQQAPVIPSPQPITQEQVFQHERHSFLDQLQEQRQIRLQQCDWTRLDDVQSEHTAEWNDAWLEYRRALRAIVDVYTNPPYDLITDISQVAWPISPQG
jgi:hypothetical protein